jgi:hypothetical protein
MSICCLEGECSDSSSIKTRPKNCLRIRDIVTCTCIGSANDRDYVSECGETAKNLDF